MSPRPFLLVVLLTASLAAAGCLSAQSEGAVAPAETQGKAAALPADWVTRVVPGGDGHDHADPAQHAGITTPNFRTIGWNPLVTDHYGETATGMGCGGTGVNAEGRKLALVHSIDSDLAFVVADITDPANPQKLGEYVLPNVVVWDATMTPDGNHAIVGAYPFIFGKSLTLPTNAADLAALALANGIDPAKGVPVQPLFRDCMGNERAAGPVQYLPLAPAIIMVGIQDPMDPQLEHVVPQPVIGPHSVYATEIDGTTFVASSVTNLEHKASYYHFFEVVDTPAGSLLGHLSALQAPGAKPGRESNGHVDVAMHKHPVTGDVLAYLANWGHGVAVYNFNNPRAPMLVADWTDGDEGNLHNTWPLPETWGDKHYTIVGQEVGAPEDRPSGWVYILDTTDPASPVEVGRWTLPVSPVWGPEDGLLYSTHYIDVLNRTMFVTNYHGGMWAVDLTDVTAPRTVGIFLPDRVSPSPLGGENRPFSVEDVVVDPETGILTVWDGPGGIYQLRFDETDPAPRVLEWPVPGEMPGA